MQFSDYSSEKGIENFVETQTDKITSPQSVQFTGLDHQNFNHQSENAASSTHRRLKSRGGQSSLKKLSKK
jgi:hypothetical protein